ncbi:related to quinate transport protein [Cephalotrichum gorgonifer]|uniref:Related to quinate transport protein n=1 Tax=Cephalotrichum gorgonifer TaxID=2041049 RepID=A0AAE8T0D3_9PEZI|nr:related to quinate transport protein [Cephalotrichum gorgonifer]
MSDHTDAEPNQPADSNCDQVGRKRARRLSSDSRYPRKRSVRACHVCRARKTKCDNVQPTCGFCASLGIQCSYDSTEKDHSSFDPATLEILRQLGQIIHSQEDILHTVRAVAAGQTQCVAPGLSPANGHVRRVADDLSWDANGEAQQQQTPYVGNDWLSGQQSESASTTPAAGVAAVRWFGLLATDASREALEDTDVSLGVDGALGFLGPEGELDENDMTPLQKATRIIDGQMGPAHDVGGEVIPGEAMTPANPRADQAEERMWQASENICLLAREQVLFENFLNRICSWLDLFDPGRTFSTRVPHLAVRNAGLLNAILALSGYHQSLDGSISLKDRADQNSALQYYYQTLHYVQKAMRYSSYQNSQELMATTLIVSTYEMLRGSRTDWQRHLQGVFWILRSRQIEVEASSLESTTWWAWLRQDIWVAFRERRRTYSTWIPKKAYPELTSHELASRAVWILAQVINFCAIESGEEAETGVAERIGWAKALMKMMVEWRGHLTVEFNPLPTMSRHGTQVFQPRLIHPQCFGLAMQIHYVSRILLCAHEPCLGGLESFMKRQKTIQDSIEMVCGIGMTLTEDASSMLSSQCLFIAGMFMQNPRQRSCVLEMLDSCRDRCGWPTPSLGSELVRIWDNPDAS